MKVALKFISFLLFVAGGWSLQTKCPFTFLYQFGDGISDIGNSVRLVGFIPPSRNPYGITFPGTPTGRWSDGRVEIDYLAQYFGLPRIKPYLELQMNSSSRSDAYDGVVFSAEGSSAVNSSVLNQNGVPIPLYSMTLSEQLTWFKSHLASICTNQTAENCERMKLPNSVVLFEFSQLNEIGTALQLGRSMQAVQGLIPSMVQSLVDAGREVISMGATRIVYTTAVPLGCYPYILSSLPSNDTLAYDALGCLTAVNNLAISFNVQLLLAVTALQLEFPAVTILTLDFYIPANTVILENSRIALNGNPALKSCCGIGGRYNFDRLYTYTLENFCGSPGVPFCPNPNNTVYWDGLHFTQEAYRRITNTLAIPAQLGLKCTI